MAKREYEFRVFDHDNQLMRWLEEHPSVTLVSVRARGWDLPPSNWGDTLRRDLAVVAWYYREAK